MLPYLRQSIRKDRQSIRKDPLLRSAPPEQPPPGAPPSDPNGASTHTL
ncbi:hypothetical protein SSP24_62680 [Streptomyces spinoverrucosus]|uniref:Uncharacterized protein n=1 Tax=Streptomyces spinoverrucosus TaxID=284043 RepID=A0A4Y3VPU1_9ACTN|nr:hypothetical protein [Streptomyces spinoverrucosus]GEC08613.1 hypothetical protein SSP24_62680 [Streptomyces spinoverrucosus]GHB68824.1 hypothetical protein GCM10010397_43930 [Streptomyces spinoverrucosus]